MMKKAGREARKIPCARRPWNPTPSASLRAGSFRKVREKDGAPGLFVMTKVGGETAEVGWLRHPTHRRERDEWAPAQSEGLETQPRLELDDPACETVA